MKTPIFKDLLIAGSVFCITLSIFLYAIIWLEQGFKLENELQSFREIIKHDTESTIIKETDLKMNQVMPSCWKGRK